MRSLRLPLVLIATSIVALAGCAVAEPDPDEVAQGPVAEPSMQKCATSTGSRLPQTCSSLVKATGNKDAMREMQRHRTLESN